MRSGFSLFAQNLINKIAKLSVDGNGLFERPIDLQVTDRVCGDYRTTVSGTEINCNICVTLKDEGNSQTCPNIETVVRSLVSLMPVHCGWYLRSFENLFNRMFPRHNFISFRRMSNRYIVISFQSSAACPNNCSGNGVCKDGKCECHKGYYANDCSVNGIAFSFSFSHEKKSLKDVKNLKEYPEKFVCVLFITIVTW